MICPKCGSEQSADGAECTSCGIVFARFREAQERAMLARQSMSQPLPVVEEQSSIAIPRSVVIVALVIFVGFGILWTVKRKQARANYDAAAAGSAMLDEINQRGMKERQRLQSEAERAHAMQQTSAGGPITHIADRKRPADFNESDAKVLLERCSGFSERQEIRLPKRYARFSRDFALREYPALATAEKNHAVLVHVENDDHVLTPSSYARLNFEETADHYIVRLGQRRITGLHDLYGSADEASLRFDFVYTERSAGEILAAPYEQFHGYAYFLRQNGVWRVTRVDGFLKDKTKIALCR